MPFIAGYGFIPFTVAPSGDFVPVVAPGNEGWLLGGGGPGAPEKTGQLIYSMAAAGVFELFQLDGTPMGFKEIINLPVDFDIYQLETWPRVLYQNPTIHNSCHSAVSSDVPGWSGHSLDYTNAFQNDLYNPFTTTLDCTAPADSSHYFVFGSETNAVNFDAAGTRPTNKFIFYFQGTFEGSVVDPPSNPVSDGTTLTVTLPEGTTEVTIEQVPAAPTTIPAEPGEIDIIIDPGAEVIIITPGGDDGSGPPLIVPIDYPVGDVLLALDLDVAAVFQLIVNPAGIYTLVPGKTHDTLYDRHAGVPITQEVKIPDPFVKTLFLGE